MSSPGLFFAEKLSPSVLIAQTVGLTASAFFTGQAASCSILAVPVILQAPAPLAARQWAKLYKIGSTIGPSLAGLSLISFAYLASQEHTSTLQFKLYTIAAIFITSVVPFTLTVIKPTNDKLFQKADSLASTELSDKAAEAGVAKEETVHGLIDKWATLNLARTVIGGVGFFSGLWAVLDRYQVLGAKDISVGSGANRLG